MDALKFQKCGTGRNVLLCLHGFLGEAGDWAEFANVFLARSKEWQVVVIELPGHAAVGSGAICPGVDEFSGLLRDLVLKQGWGAAALAGYSLGGRLALHTALSFPDVFPHFIGISTMAGIEDGAERAQRLASDAALAARLRSGVDWAVFLHDWWNQPVFASPARHAGDFEKFLQSRRHRNPEHMAVCLETWSAGVLPSQWSALAGYPGRALLLSGDSDSKYTSAAVRMQAGFRNADRVLVSLAGHQLLMEKPGDVANAVFNFLNP